MLEKIKHQKGVISKIFSVFDRQDWIKIIIGIILIALTAICDLLNPLFFSYVLEAMSSRKSTVDNFPWGWLGGMAGVALGSIIFNSFSVYLSTVVAVKATATLRMKTFSKTQYLSASDIDKIGQSSIITRITSDATQVEQFLLNFNTTAIKAIFFIIGGFALSLIQIANFVSDGGGTDIWWIACSYGFIVIFFIVVGILVSKAMPIFSQTRKAVDLNNTIMSENIVGNKLIRIFNLEENQTERYRKGNQNLKTISIKSDNYMAGLMPIAMFFINMGTLAIYAFAGMYNWFSDPAQKEITSSFIGAVMSFVQYLSMIMLGLILISTFGYMFSRGRVSGARIFAIIDTEPTIENNPHALAFKQGDIVFKNVCFAYQSGCEQGDCKNVIDNINLTIKAGSSLGVIGQTGSGKSSFINLITRLYDVTGGQLSIGKQSVKDLNLESLHANIAVSLQDKVLIKGTIKSNIIIGKPDATDLEVEKAAKQAEAWEFISKKEGKLESIVEQRGSNLSGGQKQRVSIARALIKDPRILIFDDSTSALDTITERKILNNLKNNFKNTTKIIVSQKIKSVQDCDNIIVLDNGHVVQEGNHNKLMKQKDSIYRKIYDSQNTSLEG